MRENIADMLARGAEEAEAVAEAEERGERTPAKGQRARRQATDPSQVYTVRIPAARLEELRRVAERLGEPPSALLRRWALERLDAELGHTDAGEDPVADGTLMLSRKEFETVLERAVQTVVGRLSSLPSEAIADNAGSECEPHKDPAGPVRLGPARRAHPAPAP